jgi:hypothetical protein
VRGDPLGEAGRERLGELLADQTLDRSVGNEHSFDIHC